MSESSPQQSVGLRGHGSSGVPDSHWLVLLIVQAFFCVLCYWGMCLIFVGLKGAFSLLFPLQPLPFVIRTTFGIHSFHNGRAIAYGVLVGVVFVEIGRWFVLRDADFSRRIMRWLLYSTTGWGIFVTYVLGSLGCMMLMFFPPGNLRGEYVEPHYNPQLEGKYSESDFPLLVLAFFAVLIFGIRAYRFLNKGNTRPGG